MKIEIRKPNMEDTQFRQILNRFGFSWAGYRKVRKGVKKHLARHMHEIMGGPAKLLYRYL
ncbi:MAG: hypothetical protein DRH90_12795 [Deltaproteobacteria bacterium]|nr:MAG: hypothetical protein DRH90_12795 [Deltaproteobacteria bacterium]